MKLLSNYKDYYDGALYRDKDSDFPVYKRYANISQVDKPRRMSKENIETLSFIRKITDLSSFFREAGGYNWHYLASQNTPQEIRDRYDLPQYLYVSQNFSNLADEHFEKANGDVDVASLNRRNDPAYWYYTGPLPHSTLIKIFFCGRIYFAREVSINTGHYLDNDYNFGHRKDIKKYAYSAADYMNLLRQKREAEKAYWLGSKSPPKITDYEQVVLNSQSIHPRITEFIASLNGPVNNLPISIPVSVDGFNHFKSPVFSIQENDSTIEIVVNPNLSNLQFSKVFNSEQAFQEISMYLGNDMADSSAVESRPISDELRAETHGFDKFSFKKKKGGREKLDRSNW